MRTLIRAIKRSTLIVAILAVLATTGVFLPPAHHASAAGSPYLSLQYSSSGTAYLAGQGFSSGGSVFLEKLAVVNGQWQVVASDTVTASQCFVALFPYVHCTNTPGVFTYTGPGALQFYSCGNNYYYAYDYRTATCSNAVDTYTCIN